MKRAWPLAFVFASASAPGPAKATEQATPPARERPVAPEDVRLYDVVR